jgi:hypothetical protein
MGNYRTTLTATEQLCVSWKKMLDKYGLGFSVTIHQGGLNILRSYLFGNDLHVTFYLEQLHRLIYRAKESVSVIVSRKVKESVIESRWKSSFEDFDVSKISDDQLLSAIKEYGAYWFIIENKS